MTELNLFNYEWMCFNISLFKLFFSMIFPPYNSNLLSILDLDFIFIDMQKICQGLKL